MFFDSMQLKKVVFRCGDQIDALSELLSLEEDKNLAEQFKSSVKKYDLETMEDMLQNAFNKQLGEDNINESLAMFNSQFRELNIDLQGKTVKQKILELSKYSNYIKRLIIGKE